MRKMRTICAAVMILSCNAVSAQAILDKIDKVSDKADRANGTADRTKTTGDKIMGLFGKKNKDSSAPATTKTTVKITGASLSQLSSINSRIQGGKMVTATKMKYSSTGPSSITVQHTGSTDDLLTMLQKAAPDVFKEKNIEGLDEGEIAVKISGSK